jgi:hypothetical protein
VQLLSDGDASPLFRFPRLPEDLLVAINRSCKGKQAYGEGKGCWREDVGPVK